MPIMNGRKIMLSAYIKSLQKPLLVCALLLNTSSLTALEFREAIETTLKTSPVVQERLHVYRKTIQDYENVFGKYYPIVDAGAYWGYRSREWEKPSTIADSDRHFEQYYIELRENIFAGFAHMNEVELQKARIVSASWYYMEMANDQALETATKYMEVVKQKELLKVEQESLKRHQTLFEDMKLQEEAGTARKSDMDEIRSKLSLAYTNVRIQQNNLQDAIIEFQRRYGEYVPTEEFSTPELNLHLPQTIREATKVALRRNPSLLVMNYEIKANEGEYRVSKGKFYPQVDLTLRYSYNVNSEYFNNGTYQESLAMISLKYNLFNGTRDSATIQKNRSVVQELNSRREKLKRETIEGLQLSWSAYENLKVILPFLERHAELTHERLNAYNEDFKLGYHTLLDLLIVHDDFIKSQKDLIEHNANLIVAKARILDAMGELPEALNIDMRSDVGLNSHIDTKEVEDTVTYQADSDEDNVTLVEDVCSNTPKGSKIDYVGCKNMVEMDLIGFEVPKSITRDSEPVFEVIEDEPQQKELSPLDKKPETTLPYVEAPAYREGRAVFYFDKHTFRFTKGESARLASFMQTVDSQSRVIIYGYTDRSLIESESLNLSKQRCETTKSLLESFGIDQSRIEIKPMGETDNIIPTPDGIREPVNRRIEIEIIDNNSASLLQDDIVVLLNNDR